MNLLKSYYRIPVKILSKVTGQRLSLKLINRHIKSERLNGNDTIHIFLMYDLDSPGITEKIKQCQGDMVCCNPCIELWFLLHERELHASISTTDCILLLRRISGWETYRKGSFSERQKEVLWANRMIAGERSKSLVDYSNPSTPMFRFIDLLEERR